MATSIEVKTCQFVNASSMFRDLQSLWDEFVENGPPFSWGDNNRSLVTVRSVLEYIEQEYVTEFPDERDILEDRATGLPDGLDTYMDLEN